MVKIHKEYSVLFESCIKIADEISKQDEDLGESFMLLISFWLNDDSARIRELLYQEFKKTFLENKGDKYSSIQKLFDELDKE